MGGYRHRRPWPWYKKLGAWLAGMAAAFALIGIIGNATASPSPKPAVASATVPDVVGMSQADAATMLQAMGFRVGLATPSCCGSILWVHRQSPAPGDVVIRGSAVSVQSAPDTVIKSSCGRHGL